VDLPAEILKNDTWVYQYMQIHVEGTDPTQVGSITIGCGVQVGTSKAFVEEFQGVSRFIEAS